MTEGTGSTYHLQITGTVPAYLTDQIRCRFGPVTVSTASGLAVLDGHVADQAAVRALLTLIWDAGAEVRLLVLRDYADGASSSAGMPGAPRGALPTTGASAPPPG